LLINTFKKRIEGKIHFLIKDNNAFSPYRSLFGGYELNPRLATNLIAEFISDNVAQLRKKGHDNVYITQHATSYHGLKSEKTHNALLKNGFSVQLEAINHHINLQEKAVFDQMHMMEQRRYKKCQEAGYTFQQEPSANAKEIYTFIENDRKEKGLNVSIPSDLFSTYLEQFPQNYLLFSVRDQGKLIAATMAVRICKRILYNFLPSSHPEYDQYSPSVMLYKELAEYAYSHHYEMLDLGISTTSDGTHQESLIQFKENMGGQKSMKYTYHLKL